LETVNLAKNHTGVSKGFATLVFREPQAATDAISELNGHELSGRTLLVKSDSKPTREESRLYVGNIPYRTAWQDLKDLFRDAGYVTRVEIPSDASGKAKGFAIVTMASNEESKKAIGNGLCVDSQ
jgi:RNA recognition motif-containing protein